MPHIASSMTVPRSLIFDSKLIKYTFDPIWRPIIKCGCADKSAYPILKYQRLQSARQQVMLIENAMQLKEKQISVQKSPVVITAFQKVIICIHFLQLCCHYPVWNVKQKKHINTRRKQTLAITAAISI